MSYNQTRMSISHFFNKIKGIGTIDRELILWFFILIGMGSVSFGLGSFIAQHRTGRSVLSQHTGESLAAEAFSSNTTSLAPNSFVASSIPAISSAHNFIASKNGTMYYQVTCSTAKRISVKNQMYFATATDAQKLGFVPSVSCN